MEITLGARIAQRRAELGLTLQQVAERAGVTKSTVQRYERDVFGTPREAVLAALAKALHVSPAWLRGQTEEKSPAEALSDDALKFALFGGGEEITDAQFDEVKRFAQFIKERDKLDGR